MKYLKKFNESKKIENELAELAEFTNNCLIQLIDEGYEVTYRYFDHNGYATCYTISISAYGNDYFVNEEEEDIDKYPTFNYNDVKDYFIPYIILLTDKYNIDHVTLNVKGNSTIVSVEDIIDDKLDFNIINNISMSYSI